MIDTDAPVVVAAYRTAIATRSGRLGHVEAEHLAAPVIAACVDEVVRGTGSTPGIGDIILGNCMGPGGNIARLSGLAAGVDAIVPGMTIDRQCGSGLSAIITAAEAIRGGDARMRVAGGVESASTAPTRLTRGMPYARAPFAPAGFPDPEMGPAAQALALRYGITRARQDAYAERSHRLALSAQVRRSFDAEIVEVDGMRRDSGPRAEISGMLGRFRPLYSTDEGFASGTVTAGNSTRISDGAAAVAVLPSSSRGAMPGLALIASATIGCDPALPGIGPVGAIERLLAVAGVTLAEVAAIEIVEAFAAQTLAVLQLLGLADDRHVDERVCADGGALAIGHPWGASGAVSVVRLFSRLVREGAPAGTLGIATAAIGGGMGVAALFEVVR